MGNDLRDLLKQERFLRKKFEAVRNFLDNYDADLHSCQVDVRLQRLDQAFNEFQVVRKKIEVLTEEEDEQIAPEPKMTDKEWAERVAVLSEAREEENWKIMSEMEEHFCILKSELMSLKRVERRSETIIRPTTEFNETSVGLSRVKLPDIRLPNFSGQLKDWMIFRDNFESLIHRNTQLMLMDKFTYLRSSLTGEALQTINTVEMSAANYDVAWTLLQNRYENKKLIVKAYLDALFSVESLRKESYDSLNRLISDFEMNLMMLDKVGEQTANWSTLLVHMMCARLDGTTLRHWESHHNSKEVPSYEKLIQFLRNHCSVLQSIATNKPGLMEDKRSKLCISHATAQIINKCFFCGDAFHSAFRCSKFLKMKVPDRVEISRRNALCLNCLSPGHQARFCSKGSCHHCRQKHHSLLHTSSYPVNSSVPQAPRSQMSNQQQLQTPRSSHNQPIHTQTTQTPTNSLPVAHANSTQPPPTTNQSCTCKNTIALPVSTKTRSKEVLLSTAIIRVIDRFGNTQLARALLDSCSQFCFMTTQFCQRLNFIQKPEYLTVQGIGGANIVSRKIAVASVLSRLDQISTYNAKMNFFVLPELTVSLPTSRVDVSHWKFPDDIVLADPTFGEPGRVDIIIGAEHYYDLLADGRIKFSDDSPTLQNSVFGWIVSGTVPVQQRIQPSVVAYTCTLADVHNQLTKFWEVETCRSSSIQSVEETACETFFEHTTTRDESGRFVVKLPKREFVINRLGESRNIAMKRLQGMERRFQSNIELRSAYQEFMSDYHRLGHMRLVNDHDDQPPVYYLPHHAILKPDSTTTKLRVVFDASCKTSTGVSLNDALMVGPVVQDDLVSIVIRFRFHKIALVADIEKMYRMIQVHSADQRLQRILWRDSIDEPFRTYELSTVTYGTASAPYLATKCLQQLAESGRSTHPHAAKVLEKDYYMDDQLTGTDSIEEGKQLISEMQELTSSGGLTLRKWNSNCRGLLEDLPTHLLDDRAMLELDSSNSTVKTLGLLWEPRSDRFLFKSPIWNHEAVVTKRIVLADAARLFDPLGLVGPVVILAKIFMQDLWKQKCDWDDPLPDDLQSFWIVYRRDLQALSSLTVPRWVQFSKEIISVEIHGFCDASEKAYGACLYLRCTAIDGSVEVNLIIAKSKVAPLEDLKRKKKKQTIPRLELSSALLLSHVYEKVITSVNIPHTATFWTDSTIVLCWLSSLPSRWQMFVANRVSEIQHITKGGRWNHIAGVENPADIISRGMSPTQLQYQRLWFKGPLWLCQESSLWPSDIPMEVVDSILLEEKSAVALPAVIEHHSDIFFLRSSLFELVRLVALILRFKHNCRHSEEQLKITGFLNQAEHEHAMIILVRLAQRESFAAEISALQKGHAVATSSSIASLNPIFIDDILRVGGRLANAAVSTDRKHPIILSYRHPLTKLIMIQYHQRLFHAGLQLLVSIVREKYWPTRIRRLANTVIHECVSCFRTRPKVLDQLMADLPAERVSPAPPFLKVGVDYCGPFPVAYPGRRTVPRKLFISVFVCLVTKAVHLELSGDLTSEAFLAAFKRFIARRGKPVLVMCDNGLNFVGAKRKLDVLRQLFLDQQFQQTAVREAAQDGIEFRFIPPRSPNFGGLWEAAVKSFKTHFKRSIGVRVLQHDEMQTVVTQIEAVLNSRPLTPISNDPTDYEALTPGHFLVQRPLSAIPEPCLLDIPVNRLAVWQRAQQFVQIVWKKWSVQYLSDLHNRTKWTRQRDNISIGTMVLVKEDNLPPLKWRLGRVVDIHQGSDGNICVVTVRTKDGEYRRAISKICVLPIQDNQNASSQQN